MHQYFRTSKARAIKRVLLLGLTTALYAIGIPQTSAQEAASEPDDTRDTAENGPQPQNDPPAKKTSGGPSGRGEVFVPTEEISEDYAVSFPVDI